ncbi:LPS export ABC transporter permease LptG [Acinetobacter sp.]|uniref:LPS export ABC transporter permease LptG n=1 Tax=Acinetobacter sp. TaxID=472 RepID=UPI0031DDC7D0
MFARRLIAKHVTTTATLAMLGTTAVLGLLQALFTYLAELSALKKGYTAVKALEYVFWNTPHYLYEILPIAALIGAVIGLGTLASNSELIVMRSVGISLWRIVGWVIRSALLLVILSFVLIQWVIPYTNERADSIKKQQEVSRLGEVRGYWTREGQRFIYIDYANSQGELRNIQILDFDQNYRLKEDLLAEKGSFGQQAEWNLQNVQQTQIQPTGDATLTRTVQLPVALALQPKYVHMVTADPDELAPGQLVSFMRYLSAYSQVPKTYQLAFWQKVAMPFSVIALVVIACSFIFGPLRQQSMGFRLVIALFVGLGFYYMQDFLGYASLVYSPSPAWFVFVPILLIFMVGGYLLNRAK